RTALGQRHTGGLWHLLADGVPECSTLGIDLTAVDEKLVVEMRTRRDPGHSDITNDVAAMNRSTDAQRRRETGKMGIGWFKPVRMTQTNVIAVSPAAPEILDHAISCSNDRRPQRRLIIHALVEAPTMEHGVNAPAKG